MAPYVTARQRGGIFMLPILFLGLTVLVFQGGDNHGPPPVSTTSIETKNTSSSCSLHFKDPSLEVCYFVPYQDSGGNFGDLLGPAVVTQILSMKFAPCDVHSVARRDVATQGRAKSKKCLFSLGSILHYLQSGGDHVWGTGVNPYWQKKRAPVPADIHLHSVRGPNTRDFMLKQEQLVARPTPQLPIGDPGYLIPFVYRECMPPASSSSEHPKFCFVPHSHDQNRDDIDESLRIIHVGQPWRIVVQEIFDQCTHVASSSLHGIVVADAMGLHSLWFQWTNSTTERTEGSFKYLDYMLSIDREEKPLSDTRQLTNTSQYLAPASLEIRRKIAMRTLDSFPFDLFEIKGTPPPNQDKIELIL